MWLSIVSVLRVMTTHSLNARFVAHFMSLALTAPCSVISPVLGNRGHSPKSPYHDWRNGVVVTYLSLFDIVQILELHG
jgi:hypothetical protein